jgi:Zn-dependent peptidase ImmA (M78 family)
MNMMMPSLLHPRRAFLRSRVKATQARVETPSGWSIDKLRAVCDLKRIRYEETEVYENLRGVVVTYGHTSIISIKESLSEREKIGVLAHELAHVALGHTWHAAGYLLVPKDGSLPFYRDPEQERDAHIWAAHLLVQPEVFRQKMRNAQASGSTGLPATESAIHETAEELNIPEAVVDQWVKTQDWRFGEDPKAWLRRS